MRKEALDVVIVDDNPALLCVLSEIFRESGHHVRSAYHGFVALAEIKKECPTFFSPISGCRVCQDMNFFL